MESEPKPCPWCDRPPTHAANSHALRCDNHTGWMHPDDWNSRLALPPSGRERRFAEALLDVATGGRSRNTWVREIAEARAVLAEAPAPKEVARRVPSVREVMARVGVQLPADSGEVDRLCREPGWYGEPEEAPAPKAPEEPKAWVLASPEKDEHGWWYAIAEGSDGTSWAIGTPRNYRQDAEDMAKNFAASSGLPLRVAPSDKENA